MIKNTPTFRFHSYLRIVVEISVMPLIVLFIFIVLVARMAVLMKVCPTDWNQKSFNFRCGRLLLPCMFYKKVLANLTDFHASLWVGLSQNTVCPWQLYERVGASNILSCFVVGRPRPEYGLPVAVYMKMKCPSSLSRAPGEG